MKVVMRPCGNAIWIPWKPRCYGKHICMINQASPNLLTGSSVSYSSLVLCLKGMDGYAICGSVDDQIVKVDLHKGDIVKKIKSKKSGTACVALRKDNKIWATGGYDGR
jgi:hypothetical protein